MRYPLSRNHIGISGIYGQLLYLFPVFLRYPWIAMRQLTFVQGMKEPAIIYYGANC